ncbi:MAG: ATP-binding protein [Bacteroidota bacterium]|nr:ATP-binding protein [Bacteroidota bacterium]
MLDYSKYQIAAADPEPSSMIETFRAIGYSLQTAVADIIDNSISANAKNIWIDFEWKGAATWLSIKDDGIGMSSDQIIQAMRPGSKNPNEERSVKDLGRFGLGLKTASFSQCRKLSVVSKRTDTTPSFWTWDLDFVKDSHAWNLIQYLPDQFNNSLKDMPSGTVIIWNDLDRLVKNLNENDKNALDKFMKEMDDVKKHLAMVFHRFIESKRVKLIFQNREIEPWDPFLIDHSATQKFPEDPLLNNKIRVRGFVLPHKSKLTEQVFEVAKGTKGWNAQQGFYIYRNERLLVAGDWLGMFRKEEHYKLARIQIDLPNNMDAEWQIDIKKSIARPPFSLTDQLKAYAVSVRNQAVEVYRHKGKILQRKFANVQFQPVWLEKIRHGKRFFEVNREHPVIQSLINSSDINQLLRLIEETVPVPLITIRESEQPELQGQPFEESDQEPVKKLMKEMYHQLITNGRSDEQAKSIILNIEPFNLYPHFAEYLN